MLVSGWGEVGGGRWESKVEVWEVRYGTYLGSLHRGGSLNYWPNIGSGCPRLSDPSMDGKNSADRVHLIRLPHPI